MKHHAKADAKGTIIWASPHARAYFARECAGKEVVIQADDAPSLQLRRFLMGAIVPMFFYLHPHSGWADFDECWEWIKYEFLPGYLKRPNGEQLRYGMSSTNLNREGLKILVEQLTLYLDENFKIIPDPEHYKRWRDTLRHEGDGQYPPLARLITQYQGTRDKGETSDAAV